MDRLRRELRVIGGAGGTKTVETSTLRGGIKRKSSS